MVKPGDLKHFFSEKNMKNFKSVAITMGLLTISMNAVAAEVIDADTVTINTTGVYGTTESQYGGLFGATNLNNGLPVILNKVIDTAYGKESSNMQLGLQNLNVVQESYNFGTGYDFGGGNSTYATSFNQSSSGYSLMRYNTEYYAGYDPLNPNENVGIHTHARIEQTAQNGTRISDWGGSIRIGSFDSSNAGIQVRSSGDMLLESSGELTAQNVWQAGLKTNNNQVVLKSGSTYNVNTNNYEEGSSQVTLNDSQASLTKRSSVTGNIHGVTVTDTETTITGGTTSTQMTLNDETVDFKHVASGTPVRLTGIADGVNRYDAVNRGQLDALRAEFSGMEQRLQRDAAQGIAGLAAINNAPLPSAAGKITMALGAGSYKGYNATGISFAYRAGTNLKGAVFNGGAGFNSGDPVIKVGVAWELN